jgi:hypothetical protein
VIALKMEIHLCICAIIAFIVLAMLSQKLSAFSSSQFSTSVSDCSQIIGIPTYFKMMEALNGNVHAKTGYIHDRYDNGHNCRSSFFKVANMPRAFTYQCVHNNLTITKLLFDQISLSKQISNSV